MVDREARDRLAAALERFMNDESDSFQFDEEIDDIARQTTDETVKRIRGQLWYCYDDCKRHKIEASKEMWDWYHRLLLLLRSDGDMISSDNKRWTIRQRIAMASLLVYGGVLCLFWGAISILPLNAGLGVVSMLLFYWRHAKMDPLDRRASYFEPFASISEILTARRQCPAFAKRPYPGRLEGRRIRHPLENFLMLFLFYGTLGIPLWLACSPLAVFVQSFPEDSSEYHVVIQ